MTKIQSVAAGPENQPRTRPARIDLHPHFAPALPQMNWVPAPRYLMRRDILLRLFAKRCPGRTAKIGCGSGALLAAPICARQLRTLDAAGVEKSERTGASGSDRRPLTRLWPARRTVPLRHLMQGALALQRRSMGTDRGIGYILVAREP